jgi:membrane fusion protein
MSGSDQSLFRPESSRARQTAWLGRPAIRLGLPVTISTLSCVLLAAALAALISFGTYTRRVDLEGVVLPQSGLIAISAPSSGWIEQLSVHEGETVNQGTSLYTIDVDTSIKHGGVQQVVIDALTAQRSMFVDEIERRKTVAAQTEEQLKQKAENLKAQLSQLGDQITMQESFNVKLQQGYLQFLGLFQNHNLPAAEMDARQQTWMAAQSTLQQLKGSKLRLQADLNNTEYQLAIDPATTRNDIDALNSKISVLDQDLANSEAHHSIEIRSPRPGVVTAIAALPGQVVSIGSRMLTIVPESDIRVAELLAPSSAVGFIRAGERVLLRYSAFPYQKFGQHLGTVEDVSRAALSSAEVQQLQTTASAPRQSGPYYRVTVLPDLQHIDVFGHQERLPADMQVRAFVLLDQRKLYEWVLEPLYSVGRALRSR